MKRKSVGIIIASAMLIVVVMSIVRTNITYAGYMATKELSIDDSYEGNGYSIKFNKYEVVDKDDLKYYCKDIEKFDAYEKAFGDMGKVVLVYATIKINNLEVMDGEWWTECKLEADNAWTNSVGLFLLDLIDGVNLFKKNYENGKEYNVIFPYNISTQQVTNMQLENSKNWHYRMLWSVNPIVYTNLY